MSWRWLNARLCQRRGRQRCDTWKVRAPNLGRMTNGQQERRRFRGQSRGCHFGRRLRRWPQAIDHQTVGTIERINAVRGHAFRIEDHTRGVARMPADPHLMYEVAVAVEPERLILQWR